MMHAPYAALRCAAFILFLLVPPVLAQDVTLTSRDGSIRLDGTILGFDGEFYRVETIYGVLTLDGSSVDCTGPGCPDLENYVATVRISGAPEIGLVLLPALVEAFAERNGFRALRRINSDARFTYDLYEADRDRPAAKFLFHLTSSAEGFADLIAEEADFALSLREPDLIEMSHVQEAASGGASSGLYMQVVALDAVVPVTARGNPLAGMDSVTLAGILTGQVANWTQLGRLEAPISVHLPESGMAQSVLAALIGAENLPALTETATRHSDAKNLADVVASEPFAIGLARYSKIGNSAPVPLRGSCGFLAHASSETLKTEDYPLTAPLFLYRPARRQPRILREFLSFILSPGAQPVIRRAGFVDQGISRIELDHQGDRLSQAITQAGTEVTLPDLQSMVGRLGKGVRLTPTFRFRDGSSDLDSQSQSSILLLAQALESGAYDGQRLEFIGFSDGYGDSATNLRLARNRAISVLGAVRRAAPTLDRTTVELSVGAFGEALPIGCDDDFWGRNANRRVEAWLFQR